MERKKIIEKIMEKKELSKLIIRDVKRALKHFEEENSDEEKIRSTRELLNKVFWAFRSHKLLSPKNKSEEWILRKHLSTRERLPYYKQVYERIFRGIKQASVIDLGAGANGFSYKYFLNKVNYIGIEAVGQLVDLTNEYFKKNKISGKMYHLSLFDLENVKEIIKKTKRPRIVLLLKMLGPLEAIERNYTKKLLREIAPLADRLVVSFATKSMVKREKFKVNRKWFTDFVKQRFKILDDFEIGGERCLSFRKGVSH